MAVVTHVFKDEKGEWRWHQVASNGQVIADSGEGYVNKQHAIKMARQVTGMDPEIDDDGSQSEPEGG